MDLLFLSDFNKIADLRTEIDELFLRNEFIRGSTALRFAYERLREVVISANKILRLLQDCEKYCNGIPECIYDCKGDMENMAFLMRGKAYRALGRFDDALDDFYKIVNFNRIYNFHLNETGQEASLESIQVLLYCDMFKLISLLSFTFTTFFLSSHFVSRHCEI